MLADRSGPQVQPKIAVIPTGGFYVSWFDSSTGGYDVTVTRDQRSLDDPDKPRLTYRYEVQVQGAEGAVEVETFSSLRIDGVRYTPQGPVLLSGDVEIPLSSVVELVSSESRSSR